MMALSRGLSSGRTLARGHREACCGLKIWLFHPHDSTKTHKSIRSGWRCDSCGELVSDVRSGWVEWLAAEDSEGKPELSGLRLVHRTDISPRLPEPRGCQYNPRDEFRKDRSIVEGLALDRFAGPDGLCCCYR